MIVVSNNDCPDRFERVGLKVRRFDCPLIAEGMPDCM